MHNSHSHPLLQQIPLTVSPFVKLLTATTLPYTYKPMPSTLPPSASGITSAAVDAVDGSVVKPKYVVSASGHAAHPDDIIASCRALQAHMAKMQADAEADIRALDERIRARELAEKRRVAPGWLDSDARLLEPERKAASPVELERPVSPSFEAAADAEQDGHGLVDVSEMAVPDEGAELDRAFGGLGLRAA